MIISISLIIVIAYSWVSNVGSKPVKKIENNTVSKIEITHRYKPVNIVVDKGNSKLEPLIKLTKKWWYFERFLPKRFVYNHVFEYKMRFYLENEYFDISVFPKSELFDYLNGEQDLSNLQ